MRISLAPQSAAEVPHGSTFSRAFAAFAHDELPQQLHGAMVCRLRGPQLVGYVSWDATAIEGYEKPVRKVAAKRGRPAKNEVRPPKTPKRLDLQAGRTLAENLAHLPKACAVGCKRNSQGHQETWIGFKLHIWTPLTGTFRPALS